MVPPYFENFGKRLIKRPKVYITDSGLACYLLGLRSTAEIERSPFLGALVEGFVASEFAKAQINAGGRRELYFFRDRPGLEVDFLVPHAGKLWMVEVKAGRTVRTSDAAALMAIGPRNASARVERAVVYRAPRTPDVTKVLAPGVNAMTVEQLVDRVNAS